jgi:sterol desaturase/sphingolipid hydroxylase (fatty acid hydroxylase superfamily)
MHRFFFHVLPVPPRRVHPHTGHHGHPDDRARIPTPLWLGLPIAALIGALVRLALGSWERAALAMAGLFLGYMAYETLHYAIHTAGRPGPLLQRWRAYHFHHHFQDERRAYGVSSPLWDLVFFTLPKKGAP